MSLASRIVITTMAIVSLLGLVGSTPAAAAQIEPASITTTIDTADIMWFGAQVSEARETIRTKIFAPESKQGHRRLWQVCSFNFSGSGEYRCGIDVAAGSYAAKRDGTWIAKLFVDSKLVARAAFSL